MEIILLQVRINFVLMSFLFLEVLHHLLKKKFRRCVMTNKKHTHFQEIGRFK